MKKFLVGAAFAAFLLPASAQAHAGHDHACLDDAYETVSLFSTPMAEAANGGWKGTDAPRYGTWGFDLSGRDTSVRAGEDFFRHANGAALDQLVIPSDRTSYGSFPLLRELSDNRMIVLCQNPDVPPGQASHPRRPCPPPAPTRTSPSSCRATR